MSHPAENFGLAGSLDTDVALTNPLAFATCVPRSVEVLDGGATRGPTDDGNEVLFPWSPSSSSSTFRTRSSDYHRLQIQNPDRLMTSTIVTGVDGEGERSQYNMAARLPSWMQFVLILLLGIGPSKRKSRYISATVFHTLTLTAALLFGACGLFFNAFDIMSRFSTTTLMLGVAKCAVGLYWIVLGVYANALAARLFSNYRFMDCIRLHSKTFLKMNMAIVVAVLFACIVIIDLYVTSYIVHDSPPTNGTLTNTANCETVGVSIALCEVFYLSRIMYAVFCLLWNILVASIYLSVCRTHTIGIRRFMKQLLYDGKIFEEFCLLQQLGQHMPIEEILEETKGQPMADHQQEVEENKNEPFFFVADSAIWDDDIQTYDLASSDVGGQPDNYQTLQALRNLRRRTIFEASMSTDRSRSRSFMRRSGTDASEDKHKTRPSEWSQKDEVSSPSATRRFKKDSFREKTIVEDVEQEMGVIKEDKAELEESCRSSLTSEGGAPAMKSELDLLKSGPPIMSNEDLLFTYFQLLRRLAATSRLLQRWMANVITFVMIWCGLMIVYWIDHEASLMTIAEFLMPLVLLGLLCSGHAEVNMEAERLLKCVLPTPQRMAVLYYMRETKLELKIYSFTMTYGTITTITAGVFLTFATRIVLDQSGL